MIKLFRILLVLVCLMGFLPTVSAANANVEFKNSKIGVVLIAPFDMKTEDFIEIVDNKLNKDEDYKEFIVGSGMQTKYQEYWFNKGELEEGKLTKDVIYDFADFSGYDKLLYLVAAVDIDKNKLSGEGERTRASVEVKGFLVDKNNTLKIISVITNDDSKKSDFRAKKGAFEQCMQDLGRQLQEYLHVGR